MATFLGEFRFKVTGCESEAAFEEHVDQVLEFLSEDDRILDPDYTATATHRLIAFSVSTVSDDQVTAFNVLNTAVRAAIHAAEGGTSGWDSTFTDVQASVREAEKHGV